VGACAIATLQSFEAIKFTSTYPKGAVLFVEGQAPHGIFVLCKGRVKLSICSTDGKPLILKIAEPAEVLGLSATVSGHPYELTAGTIDPCQVNFVKRRYEGTHAGATESARSCSPAFITLPVLALADTCVPAGLLAHDSTPRQQGKASQEHA
jgi:hypothetical protein